MLLVLELLDVLMLVAAGRAVDSPCWAWDLVFPFFFTFFFSFFFLQKTCQGEGASCISRTESGG